MSKARQIALDVMREIERGATAQAALERTRLAGAERRFVSDLVYGVLRTRLRLKWELARILPRIDRLPGDLLTIICFGAYGLLFQDKAQNYAVVNETVALARAKFGRKLGNLANAALRRLADQGGADDADGAETDPLYWAMPAAIASLWRRAYGEAAALALMRRSFQRPWPCLRVNLRHPEGQGIYNELARLPAAARIGPAGIACPPGELPEQLLGRNLRHWLSAGAISHQAAASQLILEELGLFAAWQGDPVWDACAGVGGKALALSAHNLQITLASDLSPGRLARLRSDCQRLHLPPPAIFAADAAAPPLRSWRGHILIDAPCSGLGVLSRRPDIKARFQERDMAALVAAQRRILRSLASLLQPRRELAYMTCTLNPEENEGQIAALLADAPTLEKIAEWQTPHDHPWLEGMYGCRLRCREQV